MASLEQSCYVNIGVEKPEYLYETLKRCLDLKRDGMLRSYRILGYYENGGALVECKVRVLIEPQVRGNNA